MTGPSANLQAGSDVGLIDGVTNNVEIHINNVGEITQTIRAFADGIMGPQPPSQPSGPPNAVRGAPDTRGSKLLNATDRLGLAVRELGDQVQRLRRI